MNNYVVTHLHSMDSNPYNGWKVDSVTPFQKYIDKAVELGMNAIAFTEHGSVLHNIAKHQACQKAGIKLIHAEEFYITESIDMEKGLTRDNYHCCLYARNHEGVDELNYLSSISMDRDDGHFYSNPRITFDELIHTSDNILISTACISGILCKGPKELQERFLDFIVNNRFRCWLEIQPHEMQKQKEYNQKLVQLSHKLDIPLIAANDVHGLTDEYLETRKIMQRSKKKNIDVSDVSQYNEDQCVMKFLSLDEMIGEFNKQAIVSKNDYMSAIEETNHLASLVEDYDLDYSNKYPRLHKDSKGEFKKRIKNGIKEHNIERLPNYKTEYLPRIKEEYDTYVHNDAIDFMLLDSDYKNWMLENGMHYGPSRGSVSGSVIAYLIHSTMVDSVRFKLNFSRFMSRERQSLADVDTDLFVDDRYKVREYLFNKPGLYCCNIVTFNTIQLKAAIKDVGRAFDLTPQETQEINDSIYTDDDGKEKVPEKYLKKYGEMFKYVNLAIGTVTSLGRHAAGIVCSPTDIRYDFGILSISSDPRPVSQIDMHEIDSLNYVKMDLLGLDAIGLIYKACDLAGIPYRTPDNTPLDDQKVFDSMAEDTTLIFQFESGFASESLKKCLSKSTVAKIREKNPDASLIDIMSMCSGAIRPAGESYREQLFNGEYHDNGSEALNDFLAPTLGYLVYQEQLINFLFEFCGYTMGQADIVRRHFAKKTGTENDIPVIKNGGYMQDIHGNKDPRYIKGFIATAQEKYGMSKEQAEGVITYFLTVIRDASNYLFSKNHADPYSMIGYFIGWLRYYYPLELLTAALNVYDSKREKSIAIKEYITSKGYKIKSAKFGRSKAEYFMDKNEGAIYQGVQSIAYLSRNVGDDLYDLSQDNTYTSFCDLLLDIKLKTCVTAKQVDILIKLNFFSDFGYCNKLLYIKQLFETFYGKKNLKKSKAEELGIDPQYLATISQKETKTQFMGVDMLALIRHLAETANIPEESIMQRALWESELLGYISITEPSMDGRYNIVTAVNDRPNKPIVSLYCLKNGKNYQMRCKRSRWRDKAIKTTWKDLPLQKNDVVLLKGWKKEPKPIKVGDEWKDSDELQWILTDWAVLQKGRK